MALQKTKTITLLLILWITFLGTNISFAMNGPIPGVQPSPGSQGGTDFISNLYMMKAFLDRDKKTHKATGTDNDEEEGFADRFSRAIQKGVEYGVERVAISATDSVLGYPFKDFNKSISSFFSATGFGLYRIIYGTVALSVQALRDTNDYVQKVYNIYFGKSDFHSRNKELRSQNLGETAVDPLTSQPYNSAIYEKWAKDRKEVTEKLAQKVQLLSERLPLYDGSYIKESYFSLKFHLGRLIYNFAPYDISVFCKHISFAIDHIKDLIELLKCFKSQAEVEQNSLEITKLLNLIREELFNAARILDNDLTVRLTTSFIKPGMQGGGSQATAMNDLAGLLPSLQL